MNGDTKEDSKRWHSNPVYTALLAALLTGALSVVFFSLTKGVDNSNVISGNSAKISDLQNKEAAISESIQALHNAVEGQYVPLEVYQEFRQQHALDMQRLQANDQNIQDKLDTIIAQHIHQDEHKTKTKASKVNATTLNKSDLNAASHGTSSIK